MHDLVADLGTGSGLDPQVIDLVRGQVVQIHLKGNNKRDMREIVRIESVTPPLPLRN